MDRQPSMGSHLQGGHRVKGGNASVDEFCWALTCSDSSASRTAQGGAALGEMVWQAHACREGKDGIAMVQRAKKRQKVVLFGKDGLASSRLQGGVQVRGDNAWPRQVDKVLPARAEWRGVLGVPTHCFSSFWMEGKQLADAIKETV
eukprot:1161219-Pelagomonas_calceolata.AAC.3